MQAVIARSTIVSSEGINAPADADADTFSPTSILSAEFLVSSLDALTCPDEETNALIATG